MADTIFCTHCGFEGEGGNVFCPACGGRLEVTGRRLAGHIGFVLNELRGEPMRSSIERPLVREFLERHYRGELSRLTGAPTQPAIAAAAPAGAPPVVAAAAPFAASPAAPARAEPRRESRRAVPPPPAAPREPYDWSWLAEQQANLFLFAGAFLTVIAALIYVGYSGQAVSGALKMSLLAGYTLAFLAAGVACRRIERVATAGAVFFAIGAILVPLNFVAARSIFSDEEVSATSMWLAGSMVSALFYTAVAWLGLGRAYTLAAGAALLSAALAAAHVAAMPLEWRPMAVIIAGFTMTLTQTSAGHDVRRRLGEIWSPMGQAAAALAATFAVLVAVAVTIDGNDNISTRWFLPVTLLAFALASAYVARGTLWWHAIVAAGTSLAAARISVAYAMDWPAEGYATTIAALGLVLMAADATVRRRQLAESLRVPADGLLYYASIAASASGVLIGIAVLAAAQEDLDPYVLSSRWFMVWIMAPVLAATILDAFGQRTRFGVMTLPAAAGGLASAALYGWDIAVEWHTVAIAATAAATAAAARLAARDLDTRMHAMWREDALIVARIGAGAAALLGVLIATSASGDAPSIELTTRWYVPVVFALTMLTAAFDSRSRLGVVALPIAAGATASAVLWALDVAPEWHAVSIASTSAACVVLARFGPARIDSMAHALWRQDALVVTRVSAGVGAVTAAAFAAAGSGDAPAIELTTHWFLPVTMAIVAMAAAIDARERMSAIALPVATGATASGVLWALGVSPEWHTLSVAATAAAVAGAVRFAPVRVDAWAHAAWRADIFIVARIAAVAAAAVALMVAGDASSDTPTAVDTRWFLAIAFGLVAAVAGIDASRKAMWETTSALAVSIGATVLACLWAFEAPVAAYGAALSATGIALAASGRIVRLPWIDGTARDSVAIAGVGSATAPFWPAYLDDAPRIGAGVHLAAACVFGIAAVSDRTSRTFELLPGVGRVRAGIGWLYASAFSAIAGYLFVLRSLPADDGGEAGSLAMPLLAAAIAVALAGAAPKRWRPDFSLHLYAVSLLTASAALSTAPDAQTLAIALSALTATFAAVAVYENQPLYGAPAAAFGAAAILTWHIDRDMAPAALPLMYAGSAAALYAGGFALQATTRRWSAALRATGAVFALVAPVAAYAMMSGEITDGAISGVRWYESALYQATVATVALIGVLALAEASIAGRRWIIVPASAVMVGALLMQIGRFNPDNIQAYTAVIGMYFVALGAFGLGRFRLLPDLAPASTSFEALGAATIILPTFIQSFDSGWRYDALLIAEATAFVAAGIALRRRGVLSVALFFLVAAGGRALFDAISAMPNWIVAMLAGIVLLAIGVGILAGRERWERWQQTMLRWWGEAGGGPATP